METVLHGLRQDFCTFSWFESIQQKLILAALNCEKQRGVNVWCDLLEELYKASQQASRELRVQKSPAANFQNSIQY